MGITYGGSQGAQGLLETLIRKHRDDLAAADASFCVHVLFDDEDDTRSVLKVRGRYIRGDIKISSLRDRAEGKPDFTVRIDECLWRQHTDAQNIAFLHSLLCEVRCPDSDKSDKVGRPVLEKVYPDWDVAGFDAMAALYGENSFESLQFHSLKNRLVQGALPFADHATEPAEAKPTAPAKPKPKAKKATATASA